MLCRIGFIALQVQAQGGALGARAGQAQHDARAIRHDDADALLRRHRAVDRVGVAEIVGQRHRVATEHLARQGGQLAAHGVHQLLRGGAVDIFVIVARIVVAAIRGPVRAHDVFHRLFFLCQQVEPEQHGPQAILFAHVVRSRAVAFLAAQGGHAGVEQGAEEFPARRRLVARNAQRAGDPVGRARRRHGAGDALQAGAIAGRHAGVGGQNRQAVRGRHVEAPADDHVAVAVAVRGGAEVGGILSGHDGDQFLRVDRIRVRMAAAEVFQRYAIDDAALRRAQHAFQDGPRIRAGDGVHAVKADAQAAREQGADGVEVEQLLHQFRVVENRIDHFDRHLLDARQSRRIEVDVGRVADAVFGDGLRARKHGFGDLFRRRAAIGDVVLDAEIAIGAARVMAGRQDEAAAGAMLADHAADGRRRQNAALPQQHARVAVRGRHAQHRLDGRAVVVTPVAAQHQRLAMAVAERVEHALHEVFQVLRCAEDRHLLAQARGAGPLTSHRRRIDNLNSHLASLLTSHVNRCWPRGKAL